MVGRFPVSADGVPQSGKDQGSRLPAGIYVAP